MYSSVYRRNLPRSILSTLLFVKNECRISVSTLFLPCKYRPFVIIALATHAELRTLTRRAFSPQDCILDGGSFSALDNALLTGFCFWIYLDKQQEADSSLSKRPTRLPYSLVLT